MLCYEITQGLTKRRITLDEESSCVTVETREGRSFFKSEKILLETVFPSFSEVPGARPRFRQIVLWCISVACCVHAFLLFQGRLGSGSSLIDLNFVAATAIGLSILLSLKMENVLSCFHFDCWQGPCCLDLYFPPAQREEAFLFACAVSRAAVPKFRIFPLKPEACAEELKELAEEGFVTPEERAALERWYARKETPPPRPSAGGKYMEYPFDEGMAELRGGELILRFHDGEIWQTFRYDELHPFVSREEWRNRARNILCRIGAGLFWAPGLIPLGYFLFCQWNWQNLLGLTLAALPLFFIGLYCWKQQRPVGIQYTLFPAFDPANPFPLTVSDCREEEASFIAELERRMNEHGLAERLAAEADPCSPVYFRDLGELWRAGLLTEEEYFAEKQKHLPPAESGTAH